MPLILQALAGVGEAHRRGIIHRDLKPANLMLNRAGVVKVMDFGIAKMEQSPGLTSTSTVMGSPYYMSPEQVDPAHFGLTRVDFRTDIYSMGVTLYELLAGVVPFQGENPFSIQRAHLEQEPQPPTVYYPHIPPSVVDAVLRAMAKDPRRRFQTAEEFAHALDASSSFASVTSHPQVSTAMPAATVDPTRVPDRTAARNAGQTPGSIHQADTFQQTTSKGTATSGPSVPGGRISGPASAANGLNAADAAQLQTVRPQNSLLHRWFGHTGRPRLMGTAVAALALLLLTGGGLILYAALNRSTGAQSPEDARYGGGGGGESPSGGNISSNSTPHPGGDNSEEFHLPRPAPAESIGNIPAATPETTPGISVQTPVQETAPAPVKTAEGVVAGQWTGSYTGCIDNNVSAASLSLSERAGTDEGELVVSGRLRVSTNGGDQNCAINGTFTKKANRLILQAACGSAAAPEYLSAAHANYLVLDQSQDQLSGIIQPDSPCVTVSFKKR